MYRDRLPRRGQEGSLGCEDAVTVMTRELQGKDTEQDPAPLCAVALGQGLLPLVPVFSSVKRRWWAEVLPVTFPGTLQAGGQPPPSSAPCRAHGLGSLPTPQEFGSDYAANPPAGI